MIKQAYFRGLTKVAGGYAWYKPNTWHARKNPVSKLVNPAVDLVYGITPAGRAQKKLLQGGQLTPAQNRAMQGASSWKNVLPSGIAAGVLTLPNATVQAGAKLLRKLTPITRTIRPLPTEHEAPRPVVNGRYVQTYEQVPAFKGQAPAADPIPVTTPYGTATVRPTADQSQAIQRAVDTYDAAKGVLNGERPVTVPLPGGASVDVQITPKTVDKAKQALDQLKQQGLSRLPIRFDW